MEKMHHLVCMNSETAARRDSESYNKPVEESSASEDECDIVTPFRAESKRRSGFNYDELTKHKIDDDLLTRIEVATDKRVHYFLKRGIFFSHRGMEKILESHKKEGFYLYTGRGPSSKAMHIGHLVPFIFARWLQETFDVPLVIQMSDDEKYLSEDLNSCEESRTIESVKNQTRENVKDIIALGFDVNKTFIFSNFEYMSQEYYKNICRVQKRVSLSQIKTDFDFKDEQNIGKVNFPVIQAAACFSSSFPQIFYGKRDVPCLVPCAIDQDCYFKMTRRVAVGMTCKEPAVIHGKFVPSLKGNDAESRGNGVQFKMSASILGSSIYLNDTDDEIKRKIDEYNPAELTEKEIRENIKKSDVDVIYQYLYFFMKDESRINTIKTQYNSGEKQSADLKYELTNILQKRIGMIRKKREQVTDEMVKQFMTPRPLNYKYKHKI